MDMKALIIKGPWEDILLELENFQDEDSCSTHVYYYNPKSTFYEVEHMKAIFRNCAGRKTIGFNLSGLFQDDIRPVYFCQFLLDNQNFYFEKAELNGVFQDPFSVTPRMNQLNSEELVQKYDSV